MSPSRTGTNDPKTVRGRVSTGAPALSWKSPLTKNNNINNVSFKSGRGSELPGMMIGIVITDWGVIFHVLTERHPDWMITVFFKHPKPFIFEILFCKCIQQCCRVIIDGHGCLIIDQSINVNVQCTSYFLIIIINKI